MLLRRVCKTFFILISAVFMITGVYAQELDAELVQEFETEEIEEELIEASE